MVDVTELGPTELEVIGVSAGETTVTMWFTTASGEEKILRYLVEVGSDDGLQKQAEVEYGKLQARLNELFPYSRIQLIPVADKLIVRGDARDSSEAAHILAVLTGQETDQAGNWNGSLVNLGMTANLPTASQLPSASIINLLRIPGEHQVMLKVRIAEIERTAARELGVDFGVIGDSFEILSSFSGTGNISASLSSGDVDLLIRAFSSNGIGKSQQERHGQRCDHKLGKAGPQ